MKKKHLLVIALLSAGIFAKAQTDSAFHFEIYGFAQADMGYNFNQVNPEYYDAMRPSRLPAYENQFGTDGNTYFSARQTRLGFKTAANTKFGEFKSVFDWDLFGVGVDAGHTTIRLRHAYGQLGHFGAGQLESPFMDLDVFPNTLEYWGPCGMLFLRNVQVRWEPIMGATHLVFALEKPGASNDETIYGDRVDLSGVRARFPLPDLSGHYRYANEKWGYVQLGGMLRSIKWEDQAASDTIDLSGSAVGWGLSLSAGIDIAKKARLHLQGIYGAGVENYFNDAPSDIGTELNPNDPKQPVIGVPLPNLGAVAFLDYSWTSKLTSTIGYSTTVITNSDGQTPDAYHKGQYMLVNLVYSPIPQVLAGIELQHITRENNSDGFTSAATKINVSFKYTFGQKFTSN